MARPRNSRERQDSFFPSDGDAVEAFLDAAGITASERTASHLKIMASRPRQDLAGLHYHCRAWLRWWAAAALKGSISDPENLSAYIEQRSATPDNRVAPNRMVAELIVMKALLRTIPRLSFESFSVVEDAQYAATLERNSRGSEANKAEPLRWMALREIVEAVDRDNFNEVAVVASLAVLYDTMADFPDVFGRFNNERQIEVGAVRNDLTRREDGTATLRLPLTRATGQFYVGELRSSTVDLLASHFEQRGSRGRTLFAKFNGDPMTKNRFNSHFRQLLRHHGFRGRYSNTSPKSGAALDLLAAGATVKEVQEAGRWQTPYPVIALQPEPVFNDRRAFFAKQEAMSRGRTAAGMRALRREHLEDRPLIEDLFSMNALQ